MSHSRAQSSASSAGAPLDVIVRSGTLVDGTGRPPVQADIGVLDGVIIEIGDLSGRVATEEIDARGLVVTPGFVDVHSHSDLTLVVDGRAQSALSQGVTTELVGNCGHGCTPLRDRPEFAAAIFGYNRSIPLDWQTTSEYLDKLRAAQPAVNVGTLVPLGNLRLSSMDDPEKVATEEELRQMRSLLDEGLEQGALGMSCGLQYPDSVSTRPEELTYLAKSVTAREGLYAVCMRYTDERALEGFQEPITTAGATGVRTQISHAMPMPGSPPAMTEKSFELVDNARASGLDVGFDMHTRATGEVNLSAMLPLWVLAGSPEDIDARLSSKADREKIKQYPSYIRRFVDNPGPSEMMVVLTQDTSVNGRTLSELTPAGGDSMDTIMDILRNEQDNIHRPLVLITMYPEDDLVRFYQHPECSVMSDATSLSLDGPLDDAVFYGAFTWASWYLRTIVRERKALDLAEAVRKVTSLPASRIGLHDRGVLRQGARADIAMFNLADVRETGTLLSPNQLAHGTVNVLVNGVVALRDGRLTGSRGGVVLTSA